MPLTQAERDKRYRTRLRTQLNTRTEALQAIVAALEGNEKALAVKLRGIAEEALCPQHST